jgi:transcriptional regulator with XRE-family HTH domain
MAGRLHDPDYVVFVEHLTKTRQRLGITQVDLALSLGRPQSYISKIERLERRIDIGEWRQIVIAFGLDPAKIFAEVCALAEGIDHRAKTPRKP